MSKSIVRRLSAQIPLEQQPEFLAGTFDADVLRKALQISTPLMPVKEHMPPDNYDFVWVKCSSREDLIMAYYIDGKFQNPYTVGDREGLSVEYYQDVTHWAEIKS